MQIIKKKLFKSTVAKVMAAAMVVSMIPMPTTVSVKATEIGSETETPVDESNKSIFPVSDTEKVTINADDKTVTLNSDVTLNSGWTLTDNVTLNLNGHKITVTGEDSRINVGSFNLTINGNDASEILKEDKKVSNVSSLIKVGDNDNKGTVIINGGKIQNTTPEGYGILAAYDSEVYIKGGEVYSYYAALGGNYNWGKSNFYVSNGKLEAKVGPCIYKPSAGDLFIGENAVKSKSTDESQSTEITADENAAMPELTGGVSARMGNIIISGGNIKSTINNGNKITETDGVDEPTVWSPAQYYENAYQNVYFPDALFVIGGSYGTKDTNNLKLNIAGGTFTCNNDKGSAVAIYDVGKVKQDISININGGIFQKTSSNPISYTNQTNDESAKNRTAFDVLTLKDILNNDTTIKEGYNQNSNLIENDDLQADKVTITGGRFDSLQETVEKSIDTQHCYSSNTKKVTTHDANKTHDYKSASSGTTGNIAYTCCDNCMKDSNGNEIDINDYALYYLSINPSGNITAKFENEYNDNSYGKKLGGTLKITPNSGYKITEIPTVTAQDATVICGTITSNNDGSYKCDINAKTNTTDLKDCELTISAKTEKITYAVTLVDSSLKNASAKLKNDTITITPNKGYTFTTKPTITLDNDGVTIGDPTIADGVYTYKVSVPTKNCTITVSGEATPVTYKVSLDKSGLKDANAYIIKGDNKVTTETVDATVNDKLQVVVEPNAGKVFTELPTVNGSATTLESGVYKYNVPALTGDTTLKVSGTAEDVKYSIKFVNEPTIEHATVKLEPMQAALNGKASLIIEPEAGYRITSTKAEVKDNGKVCTLSETAELGANGVFIYTISDIKGDVEITSVTATVETAELVELGTDIGNANSANLSDTFTIKGSQEEQKEQKENHTNILEAIKDIISKITKDSDSVIFDEKSTLTDADKEKLITEVKEAIESDSSKVALSLEVKEDSTVKEDVKDNAKTEITKKTANSNATVGKLYPLDISLFAHIINKDGVKIKLKDTQKGQIAIKMKKPADIPEKPASVIRRYYMVCFHENESPYTIDVTENEDGTLSFKGSQFSTYILSYVDTPSSSSSISGGGTPVVYPGGSSGGGSTGGSGAQSTSTPTPTPAASTTPVVSEAPSTTSAAPNTEPSTIPSAAPSTTPSTPSTPDTEPTAKPVSTVKVGQKVTDASVNYKVTSVSGSRTVTVTGSKSVKNVVIPVGVKINGKTYKVTAIANNAYKGNKNLTKITIGSNVSKIGKNAFSGCVNLKKITIKTTKLTASKVGKNAFKGINKKATIKVPKSKVKTYKKIIKARGISKSVKIK